MNAFTPSLKSAYLGSELILQMSTLHYLLTCFAVLLLIVTYLSPRAKTMTSYWIIYAIEVIVMITIMNLLDTFLTERGIANANAISFSIVMFVALLLGINGWQMQKRIKGYEEE